MKIRIVLTLALFSVVFGAMALGQQNNIQQDDRYIALGYNPPELHRLGIQWPDAPPDLAACKAQEPYEPHYTNLLRYVPEGIKFRVQTEDECAWTLAGSQWLWKKRPVGTKVAVDDQGRDLFDLGDGVGQVCGNPRPVSYTFPKPTPLEPPGCVITGNADTGFGADVKLVTRGKMYLDGKFIRDWRPGDKPSPELDNAGPGEHTFRLDVVGPGGSASCRAKFKLEAPPPPPAVVETPQHTCPTCTVDVQISPDGQTFLLVATFPEGYLSGAWYIDGKKIGEGSNYPVSYGHLLELAGTGEHEIVFKAVDGQGHEVVCSRAGIKLVTTKHGRYWVWWIPGLNCAYAWTADIKNWSVGGAIEKLSCVAAGVGTYYVLVHGTLVPLKIWIPGRA